MNSPCSTCNPLRRSLDQACPLPICEPWSCVANGRYKNSAQSRIQEVQDPRTGNINLRYVNRSREQHFGAQVIGHQHAPGDVPTEPTKQVLDRMAKLKQPLIEKLRHVRLSVSQS